MMLIESLLEWIRRQGLRVVSTEASHWYEAGPRIYQAIPYHQVITPSQEELRELLFRQRAIGLRYSTGLDEPEGRVSYHVVNADKAYDLAQLPKKARYDVRKGLEYAVVEPTSFGRLAAEGWNLRQDTLKRQGRTGAETPAWWERLCTSAEGLPGFETWAAIHEGRLVAALLACTTGDCCSVLYQQSLTDALEYGVNNALTYCFTKEAIARPEVTKVFYGLDSLDADENVDRFKFRMNYVAQPVRQRVVFHPWARWCFNGVSHALLRAARRRWPEQSTLAKAEGMIRFYREGRKPLAEQGWPDCLAERKAELLKNLQLSPSSTSDYVERAAF
jgi:hypothetical protein